MENLGLQEIKGQLGEIDQQLVKLIEQRMKLCGDVAEFRIGTGKPVYDGERGKQKLQSIMGMVQGDFNRQSMYELFTQLTTISRKYQYGLLTRHGLGPDTDSTMMDELRREGVRIVYRGVEGAYNHGATIQFSGEDTDMYHVAVFEDAIVEVEEDRANYAVPPIEDSLAGAINDNYNNLVRHNLYIVGGAEVPVTHALLGLKGARFSDIERVYSHPQGLMQCSPYLNANWQWTQFSVKNTAGAARRALENQDISQTAMANETVGRIYGLQVLERTISHNKDNITRFIILSRYPVYGGGAGKVSICFEGLHKGGFLYNILGNFTYSDVNILMTESRPIVGHSQECRFFVDMEGCLGDTSIQDVLKGASGGAVNMRILGDYQYLTSGTVR